MDRYYVGYTHDLTKRIKQHQEGFSLFSKYTSTSSDWVLKYSEKLETKTEAIAREKEIKRWKSRKMIERLIDNAG